jgi:hypothetical protein
MLEQQEQFLMQVSQPKGNDIALCVEEIVFSVVLDKQNQLHWGKKILSEQLVIAQLIKKVHVFYGTRRFIIVFTRAADRLFA